MEPSVPLHEAVRLEALRSLKVLDTPAEQVFDDITALAASICATPMALITLVDKDRVWFKSRFGMPLVEIPREGNFCSHAIEQNGLLIVGDARADARFSAHPLV